MAASILYHCTCTSVPSSSNITQAALVPPAPNHPSSPFAFHPLQTLFFCEECDAVRCNRCVSVEVSGYYCPNCLFEVPGASVRAEKNRCARNCFQCPHCSNTLSIVSSDPPPNPNSRLPPIISPVGEPPFFLYCNYCRWDSAEAGVSFDKPTGLALQLQKTEDSAPDAVEFERLKEHFEPLIRASSHVPSSVSAAPSHSHQSHHSTLSALNAAASSALARDVPGIRRKRADPNTAKDEWGAYYKSRIDTMALGGSVYAETEWIRDISQADFALGEVANLEQRWIGSWTQSMRSSELKPLRIPLHSKQTKRCPKCRHILIKPEQKSQSVRYKIKLMAANYLPAIDIMLLNPTASRTAAAAARSKAKEEAAGTGATLQAGKTYGFHLALTNPLYEPIQVRLSVQRSSSPANKPGKRPAFVVSLPTSTFAISAYAEAWEYEDEDDDEMMNDDDLEDMLAGRIEAASPAAGDGKKGKVSEGVGVLERKANVTKVGGEVVIGREGEGDVKFNVMVSYTYRADDPAPTEESSQHSKLSSAQGGEIKTFSFYTVVSLGTIQSLP